MSLRLLLVALLAAFLPLLAGCGDGPDEPEPTPTIDATSEPVQGLPVLGPADQGLEFFGEVEGVMTFATVQCTWIRGNSPENGRLQVALEGTVNGARHRLRIIVNGYTGPDTYEWDGVPGSGPEVTVDLDGARGHARVVVEEPGDNGDIEAALTTPTVGRIAGFWQCPGTPR